jgi:enterochelin esterase family protein
MRIHQIGLMLLILTVLQEITAQTPQRIVSPDILPDGRVIFRLRSPNAKEVLLAREGTQPVPMSKDDQGLWTVTTPVLEPDIYGYSFVADGVRLIDPSNPLLVPNLLNAESAVHVPGPSSLPWEVRSVPHGTVHHHFYDSSIVGDHRDFFVYTPASYTPSSSLRFPVLYLLHGFSDDASAWTSVGYANVILDNLIADGKAKPMIVVMPLGYGAPEILTAGARAVSDSSLRNRNFTKFTEALLTEVLPKVEAEYRVSTDRASRAVAGLSMGGAESLLTGLLHPDRFAWIGAFSSGSLGDDFSVSLGAMNEKAAKQLKLLWISCGSGDRLIAANRKFHDWLTSKGIPHQWIEPPGSHTWMVWRRNLAELTTLLFKEKNS